MKHYALYKIDRNDARWLVGYYDDVYTAAGAIEEDKAKHDDNDRYELIGEDEQDE